MPLHNPKVSAERGRKRRVRCKWGLAGARHLAQTCTTLSIVDVQSFSTCIDIATGRGALVFPSPMTGEDLAAYAASLGAELAGRRHSGARYSLSPPTLMSIAPGTRLVLPSPNGSTISRMATAPLVFAGCLRNASAVAVAAAALAEPGDIGVVPAGEHWADGTLRPAIEDWLGAGAVIAGLAGQLSAEALAARAAFRALRARLVPTLRAALSGRELIAAVFADDVEFAAALDVSTAAPRLVDGAYRA